MNMRTIQSRDPSLVALLLASSAMFAACSVDQNKSNDTVNTYTVSREDLPINVKESGELVAVNETVVRSLIEGNATILSLIPEGTLVKPGDQLVELDVSELVEKRASQEILVEKSRNALEQARTAGDILEKELLTKKNTADSQCKIAAMELEKLLGASGGQGSEGKNADMVKRLQELVNPAEVTGPGVVEASANHGMKGIIAQVDPRNYAGLIDKVTALLDTGVATDDGQIAPDPLQRDMGEMANKILQQADQIRLAMAKLKISEDQVVHSRRLASKQFITRSQLEGDEFDYQSQASQVTIAWNNLELLINYTLGRDKIELMQNLENAELEVERVQASNDAERKNSQFDVEAKQKEFEVAAERLQNLEKQIGNALILSPGTGLVVYSNVSRGRGDSEPIEEGTSIRERQSIIILPDNSKLKCKIQVQEAMIDRVRVGLAAHISAEVRPNEVITGRVIYVAPVADSQSRWGGNDKKVYTTYVLLDGINSDESLKAGMKASATITVDTVPQVLTVPIQSVRRDRSVNYVWKKTASGPQAVAVEVGANNQEKVAVSSGLAEGDVIYRVPPGGQADPKFDQPILPEPMPANEQPAMAGDPGAEAPRNGSPGDTDRQGGGADGGARREGRTGRTRKKYTEMNAAELAEGKQALEQMAERFGSMLDAEKLDEMNQLISDITAAIDANELEKAQLLRDTGFRKLMPSRGNRGGGEQGGERGGRNGG